MLLAVCDSVVAFQHTLWWHRLRLHFFGFRVKPSGGFILEHWTEQTTVYSGAIFDVVAGKAALDTGEQVPRDVVVHDGGVAVVPLLGESVMLIRQFRIAVGEALLELPAGRREGREDPAFRAGQELEEEIGYRAGRMDLLTTYFSSAGFTNERMHIFVARDLVPVERRLEFDERIELVTVPLTELPALIASGSIKDAKTLIGLLLLRGEDETAVP
jgi:ADP-ribose pyrophosphatase